MSRKRIYLSYKQIGEDPEELKAIIQKIGTQIRNFGQNYIFDSRKQEGLMMEIPWRLGKINAHVAKKQAESNLFVALVHKEISSDKMKMDLVRAIELKQHIILLIKKGLDFQEFRDAANITIEFCDFDTLFKFGFPFE